MENGVLPHCFCQAEFVSIPIDDFTHSVWSHMFVVEILTWSSCLEVLGREPNFVLNVEQNLFSAGLLRLPLLGIQYVLTDSPISLCQSLECSVHLDLQF